MFDFRYHVASLAAVFLALVVGIVVGVGISGKGIIDSSERQLLQNQINGLQAQVDRTAQATQALKARRDEADAFIDAAYPALMRNRLADATVTVLVVGPADGRTHKSVEQALEDAGASEVLRVLRVPVDAPGVRGVLSRHRAIAPPASGNWLGDVGHALARELLDGAKTPLWEALAAQIVAERQGALTRPAGVVVLRTAKPQTGATARFLAGLYSALGNRGVPVVGVETSDAKPTTVPVWQKAGISSVDNVETPEGRLALALVLAGGEPGRYGIAKGDDALLPAIEPVTPTTGA